MTINPPNLLATVSFQDYWIALAIGAAFLLMQITLCGWFVARLRRYTRIITRISHSPWSRIESVQFHDFAERFPWLDWIRTHFSPSSASVGNFTREDVLKELDFRIAGDSGYVLLQRTGIMAPLLGVLITVGGFVSLQLPDSGELQLQDILLAVTPLVAGVGIGAALAFINQWLLHIASGNGERLRITARQWFDASIWGVMEDETESSNAEVLDAISGVAESLNQSVAQQGENAQVMANATELFNKAAGDLSLVADSFHGQLDGIPENLGKLGVALQAAVEAVASIGPKGQEIISGLDVSVSAFRTAIDMNFNPAVRRHEASIQSLADFVELMKDSSDKIAHTTQNLANGSDSLANVIADQESFRSGLMTSLEADVLPAHAELRRAAESIGNVAGDLTNQVRAFANSVESILSQVNSVTPAMERATGDLVPAVSAFRRIVEGQLDHVATDQLAAVQSLSTSAERLQELTRTLQRSGDSMGDLLGKQAHMNDEISSVGNSWRRSLDEQVLPAQKSLHDSVHSFSDSADRLAKFINQGLDPVTQRLVAMDESLRELKTVADSLRGLADVRQEITQLSDSLKSAARMAEVVGELPEQIMIRIADLANEPNGITAHGESQGLSRFLGVFRGSGRNG